MQAEVRAGVEPNLATRRRRRCAVWRRGATPTVNGCEIGSVAHPADAPGTVAR
jgi:hypothetical protein